MKVFIFDEQSSESITDSFVSAIRSEAALDFPSIRRLPSTEAKFFIDYCGKVPGSRLNDLLTGLGKIGAGRLQLGRENTGCSEQETKEVKAYYDGQLDEGGWGYVPLKVLKQAVGWEVNTKTKDKMGLPDDLISQVNGVTSAKANDLRKVVSGIFADMGLKKTSGGSGLWSYAKHIEGLKFEVDLDFGGMVGGMRYSCRVEGANKTHFSRLSLEGLLGFGTGEWDYITEESSEDALNLLGEIVSDIFSLPGKFEECEGFQYDIYEKGGK